VKLNQRTLSSTPHPKFGNDCQPSPPAPAQFTFFIQFFPRLPTRSIIFHTFFQTILNTSVKILQFYKCQNFTILGTSVKVLQFFRLRSTTEQMPALVFLKKKFANENRRIYMHRRNYLLGRTDQVVKKLSNVFLAHGNNAQWTFFKQRVCELHTRNYKS
jgi:hypothetical protein